MTFQGDVGGIGLADLLQSLARGRDGILTLIGRGGLQSTLGVEGGMIHLLADPSEEGVMWRDRARAAWIGDPNSRIDSVRMSEIARAHRVETVYRLLDSDSVHFRFAPGPLPKPPEEAAISKSETGFSRPASRRDAVWCAPLPVDALLLEYARLKDEAAGLGRAFDISAHAVLILIDTGFGQEGFEKFAKECDGTSSLVEVADRLGWPLRQMRIVAGGALLHGAIRLAQPQELLTLAQRELLASNPERAASRFAAWYENAEPGPLPEQDADFVVHEWNAGRIQTALRLMPPEAARALLRRVDCVVFNPSASAERWKEYADVHAPDAISNLRVLVCRIRSGAEDVMPPIRELLAVARSFNERRQSLRAAAILRVVAARQPETSASRIDLGLGFLSAGFPNEGSPWILEAAKVLIEEDQGEKAVPALRALVEQNPSNREARRLLSRARAGAVRRKLTGKHALLFVAGLALIAATGWVRIRSKREFERKLAAVTEKLSDPEAAMALLEQEFPGDLSLPVQKLRTSIAERRHASDVAARTAWTTAYREAQTECARGDPVDGLRKILALPETPKLFDDPDPWPAISELYQSLAVRGEESILDLGKEPTEDKEQIHAEQRAAKLFQDLKAELAGHQDDPLVREYEKRLVEFQKRLDARGEARAAARADRLHKENQAKQDLLLAAARAHAQAGDHLRALTAYKELLGLDESGKLGAILAKEIAVEEKRTAAIQEARDLASNGKHAEARAVLAAAMDNPGDFLLPWKVQTVPSGARARLKDGTVRVTPFTMQSTFGEKVAMTIEKDGCESVALEVDAPCDRTVYLTRAPERWWKTKGRVEALPLVLGEDHLVCDRSGEVARLGKGGTVVWSQTISSLAGVARSPVLLPKQRGKALLVSEEGEAFLCDVATGSIEGPEKLGSPPIFGPVISPDGIRLRLRDGRTELWTDKLSPETDTNAPAGSETPAAPESSLEQGAMVVLRRTASGALSLTSPWTGWTVDVGDKACTLRARGEEKASASVRRDGPWIFVAWEEPRGSLTQGRLWIADGLGLRSYVP
jgi:hypothetical protein